MIRTERVALLWELKAQRKNMKKPSASITVQWNDQERKVLEWRFSGDWDSEMYFRSLQDIWDCTTQKSALIDLVIDLRDSGTHPNNLTSLIRSAFRDSTCIIQRVIVVSQTNFWERIFMIVRQTHPILQTMGLYFVPTIEAAHILLSTPPPTTSA